MTLLGFFGTLPLYSTLGLFPKAEARTSHYTYCNANDYYETWQSSVNNSNGGLVVNEEMHYRVNNDCTWKAYWQNYHPVGGGGRGGAIPQYQDGPDLYQGVPGNPSWFDGAYSSCTNGDSTDYFGQTSASAALIQTQTQWWTTSDCLYGPPALDSYFLYNQP